MTTTYDLHITLPENPKILLAFFSYSGNTAEAAEYIQRITGADMVEIEMVNPYRGNIYEVSQLDLMQEIHPELTTRVEDIPHTGDMLNRFEPYLPTSKSIVL